MLHYDHLRQLDFRFYKKGGGGGGATDVQYVQSPEARKAMGLMMPTMERIGAAGVGGPPLWEPPAPPTLPGLEMMMPTAATMGAIAPEVREAVMAPYTDVSRQLTEQLGAAGQLGSARGGISGAGATGLGRYWADVAPEYTKSLWGMTAPAQMAGWGREADLATQLWQQQIAAQQFPFGVIPGVFGAAMPSPVVQQPGGGKK